MRPAVCQRKLYFEAGPESYTFHACAEHRVNLETNGGVSCFFTSVDEPLIEIEPVDAADWADWIECDFCEG